MSEGFLNVLQPPNVGNKTRSLHTKQKSLWRDIAPLGKAFWRLQCIEGAIDFNGGHLARSVHQFLCLR
jgi:hypothetical protein